MNPLSHPAIDDLIAAYALDAVEADEAMHIEVHLSECGRCRAVLADFRTAAAHLATPSQEPPPPEVWDAIAAQLQPVAPSEPDRNVVVPIRRRVVVLRRIATAAAAAAVVAIVGLGAQVTIQGQRIDEMQVALEDRTVLAAALVAEGHPDARRAELRSPDGGVTAHAVVTPQGEGYLRAGQLRELPRDRTYQLWAVIGTERISAGLLGSRPEVVPFHLAGDIIGLAVTEEAAGGVVASETQPVASGVVVDA